MTTTATTGATGNTGTTAGTAAQTGVGLETGRESSLSNWAGPYVTNMLGQGQALSYTPYQAYTGPLTAGQSQLQQQAFSGLAGLTVPQVGSMSDQNTVAQYMNPYLSQVLSPQIAEARRQSQIENLGNLASLTKAGAFGGSRQAIMESENQRNLLQNLSGITGKGYATAYDKALEAIDKERNYGLGALQKQAELGGVQRDIEQQGIEADIRQFEAERDDPFKKVQFQQSLLQNLPLATQSMTYSQPSLLSQIGSNVGGIQQLYDLIFGGNKTSTTTGGAGTDTVAGGGGNDTVTGSGG